MFKKVSNYLLAGTLLAATLFLWALFAPSSAGGNSDYVLITGNSMSPVFNSGDLVIVHKESDYQPGDVIAYRDPVLNKVIIHRIETAASSSFITKGDHNNWFDSYQPNYNDIIGKYWISVPNAGAMAELIRKPVTLASLAGIIAALIFWPVIIKTRKREIEFQ